MSQVPNNPNLPKQRDVIGPRSDIDLIQPGDLLTPLADGPRPRSNDANHTRTIFIDGSCSYEDSLGCCEDVEAFLKGLNDNDFDWRKPQTDYEDWDSFAQMQLITSAESKFNIQIDIDDVISITSAQDLLNYIKSHI